MAEQGKPDIDLPDIDLRVDSEAIDHARDRREALGAAAEILQRSLERPGSDPSWALRVAEAMQGLSKAFDDHRVDAEADEGLLPQLRRDAPRLSTTIAAVEAEHVTIAAGIDAAAQLISSCGGDCGSDEVAMIRESSVDVLRSISLHRQRGADLLYDAYSVDIGGG